MKPNEGFVAVAEGLVAEGLVAEGLVANDA
jgi:hypothetical protein